MTPSSSVVLQTNSQLTVQTDVSKTFVGRNYYKTFQYTNGGGSPVQLNGGALMGRISATQKVVPLASAAVNGSQFPIGILAADYIVAAGDTQDVRICVEGDVVKNKVLLDGSDTMATVISGRSIEDRIGSDTVGIYLVESTENSVYDNN